MNRTPEARSVVVTGRGVVAPGAPGVRELSRNTRDGLSFVRGITRFDASGFPVRIAAEVDGVDAAPEERIPAFAALASDQAVLESGLAELDPGRVGVVAASGMGTYGHEEIFGPALAASPSAAGSSLEGFNRALLAACRPRVRERRTPGSVAASLATRYRITGPVSSLMTACTGGTQAIGDALRWIRSGLADAVLAGGSDSEIYPMGLASFCLLGALSTRNDAPNRASRPFDRDRDGFVLGEGAGFLVLEAEESARARNARILGRVLGFGAACDAFRVTDPHPEGRGAVLAMRRALSSAGLGERDIGYVNAHGTGTPAGDRIEALALHAVFPDGVPPTSSTKSMI
ncbi:MAG: beta-ketoacyl-[acyl-carrier-protein] synthase family protein, partial [Acidobacteria bacterium]|nr:beta-ketoacyl-[acyl-carrier-protein] synthase family protein [Acidobacteriota bacterium]